MSFGITAWLWVITAAVIPVIVHLWSRKSGKPKMFPTFRFLPEKNIALASRIELHEKTLLLLRLVLILLVSLLLAGLFIDADPQEFASVKITETNTAESQYIENGDVLELQVASERIDRLGWFRLIEQAEYDYRPMLIVAEGRLTADRFAGKLPKLSADVEWVATDMPDIIRGGSWLGSEDDPFFYTETRSDSLLETTIEPADESNADFTPNPMRLIINSNLGTAQKTGFEQVADLWKIEMIESEMSPDKLAEVQYGDSEISLTLANFENSVEDYLMAGPQFGIQLPVSSKDSMYAELRNMMADTETIFFQNNESIELTAIPDDLFAEWFYTGVAHQLLKKAIGINGSLQPELTDDQRQPLPSEETITAGMVEKESAAHFLLFLILLVWAGERMLSNKRGM